MGEPIKNIPNDTSVSLTDYLVGTDALTGKTYNYPIEDILALAEAVSGGVSNTANIKTVTETATKTWDTILNELVSAWVVNPADVPFLHVNDQLGSFKALYVYKRSSSTQIKIGVDETQITTADFLVLRQAADFGEVNTMSSEGTGIPIYAAKSGVDFPMQSLQGGVSGNILVSQEADGIHIDTTASLGEDNTASSVGSGVSTFKQKSGVDLEFKSLVGKYCDIGGLTDEVEIQPWGKIVRNASFIVSSTDAQRTIQIDNGATPVVITVPDTLSVDFEMAVVQLGTGEVSFITSGTASILGTLTKVKGQYQSAWIETKYDDSTKIILLGDIKA